MSFSEVLRSRGVPVRSTTFKEKDDEEFITKIRQVLEIPETPDNFGRVLPKLAIVDGNDGIIRDIEGVSWLRYKNLDENKPKLDISHRDYLACLKYALATNIAFVATTGTAPKTKRSGRSAWSARRA